MLVFVHQVCVVTCTRLKNHCQVVQDTDESIHGVGGGLDQKTVAPRPSRQSVIECVMVTCGEHDVGHCQSVGSHQLTHCHLVTGQTLSLGNTVVKGKQIDIAEKK